MTDVFEVTEKMFEEAVEALHETILCHEFMSIGRRDPIRIGGIPRGGQYVVNKLIELYPTRYIDDAKNPELWVDDLIDSGKTAKKYRDMYDKPVFTLFNKIADCENKWVVFPWEKTVEGSYDDIGTRLLQVLGADPNNNDLRETPERFVKAMLEMTESMRKSDDELRALVTTFEQAHDQFVTVRNITFCSMCEHHMLPFFGTVSVGYIPDKKIIGLSKIPRIVDYFSKRLTTQELLTSSIAEFLHTEVQAKGVGVFSVARHSCMEFRGIRAAGAETQTSALCGVVRDYPETREEFFSMVKQG